jgi:hypothetical protein
MCFVCLEDSPFTRDYYGKPFSIRLQFMRRLCEKAKVTRFGFHAIRHLSASILFNAGYDLGIIQAIHRALNIFLKWRPQGEWRSNPCRRRERPVSWARLDDGDAYFFTSGGPCWARTNDSLLKRQILYRLS